MTPAPPRRARAPLMLAGPGRAAGWTRSRTRVALALLAALVLGAAALLAHAAVPAIDPSLPTGVADGVRHGGRYLDVAADAYRQAGYPLTAADVPLPTLAVVAGAVPPIAALAMLWLLAAAVTVAWWRRLAGWVRGPATQAAGVVLVALGLRAATSPDLAGVPEAWAGLLVALSLARWRPARPAEAIGWGLAAALVATPALVYLGVMAAAALAGRGWREAAGWSLAAIVVAGVLGVHAHALAAAAGPLDRLATADAGAAGTGALLVVPAATGLGLPAPFAAALLVLALAGWAGWRGPLAPRVLALAAGATLGPVLTGRADLAAWGLLAAPVLLLGLLALPDLLGDLGTAALDTRRITVTRVTR